jgi:hypothetical protein
MGWRERLAVVSIPPSTGDGVRWSDNMLDVFPNDPQIIQAQGLGDKEIQVPWLR